MSKKNTQLRKYSVRMTVDGDVERIVMATSEEEAIGKVKKMLLADDGQTPKSNSLNAFCWDVRSAYASIHWSDPSREIENPQPEGEPS